MNKKILIKKSIIIILILLFGLSNFNQLVNGENLKEHKSIIDYENNLKTKKEKIKDGAKNVALFPFKLVGAVFDILLDISDALVPADSPEWEEYRALKNATPAENTTRTFPVRNHIALTVPKSQKLEFIADLNNAMDKILKQKPKIANTTAHTYLEYITLEDANFTKHYENFLNSPNNMKSNAKIVENLQFYTSLSSGLFNAYLMPFLEISDKYNLNWESAIECCNFEYENCTAEDNAIWSIQTLAYIEKNYLLKYKVKGIQDLHALIRYTAQVHDNFENWGEEIKTYSINFEKDKVANFYAKYIQKLEHRPPITDIFLYKGDIPRDVVFFSNPMVIQILPNGFLANVGNDNFYNAIIFVQANDAHLLDYGDYFDPYLPLQFTGRYYTYQTIVGTYKRVPIFKIVLGQPNKIPNYKEPLYFIQKPDYNYLNENDRYFPEHINLINEQNIYKYGDLYRKWR